MSVTITPSIPSPAPVATLVTFTAAVPDAATGSVLWYRFRAHNYGETPPHTVKDYGPESTHTWTAAEHEGPGEIEVDVRNITTGESTSTSTSFAWQSRVTEIHPVISPTSHPMVYLYSAPPCHFGGRMRVMFSDPQGASHFTPYKACDSRLSMNFYLAGMRGDTIFSVMHQLDTGSAIQNGPILNFNTGSSRTDLTAEAVATPSTASLPYGIILQATLLTNSLATDTAGNLVWYYPNSDITYLTRPAPGGYFYGILEDPARDESHQFLRKVDLAGMTILETNAARVNEQLKALGKRSIDGFHHEARELPDGRIVVLGGVEQILTNVQGPGPIDVLGDMIIILSPDLEILWTWDTFDHLDPTRRATLDDQCVSGGCPALLLCRQRQ